MRARALSRFVVIAAVSTTAMATSRARADEGSETSAAAAESLFQDARTLMDARRYGEACPKFLASQRLAPGVGTLLNLADCYEKNGQLASAWVRFREAIALAQHAKRPDRERTARERAASLEPRLNRLTIRVAQGPVDVKLDGIALDPAAVATAIPVDPGKHTIVASAKGKKPFETSVEIDEGARSRSVEIPELVDASSNEPTPPPTPTPETPPKPESHPGSTQRLLGIVGMGLGAVGIGVGAFFGIRTSSQWSDVESRCPNLECDREGFALANDAKNSGNVSTIAFVAGGVLAAGGAVLFFTAPSAPKASGGRAAPAPRMGLGFSPTSLSLRGSF